MASSELLKQIQAGKKLKKADTNDRSAPILDSKPGGVGTGAGAGAGLRVPASAPPIPPGGGPPQLGSLFAGGMPKLKPAGQNNPAKPPALGKPPLVPGRVASSPAPSVPPPPFRAPVPKPSTPVPPPPPTLVLPPRMVPAPPSRAPAIPARVPPLPARVTPSPPVGAFAAPHRPPPPVRTASPPASSQAYPPLPSRAPPPVVARNASPAETSSPHVRTAPPPPPRPSSGNSVLPARKAPPPPPVRPSSIASSSPSRVAPPPPARRVPVANGLPILPAHVRALSEAESSAAPPPPGPSPARIGLAPPSQRLRVVSTPSETPPRPPTTLPNRQVNGTRPSPPTRKIPSPPPEGGTHRFPISDFPPPRAFIPEIRQYNGGRKRGSDFDLSNL